MIEQVNLDDSLLTSESASAALITPTEMNDLNVEKLSRNMNVISGMLTSLGARVSFLEKKLEGK